MSDSPTAIDSQDVTAQLLERNNLRLRDVTRRLLLWLGHGPVCMPKVALADILGCTDLELYWLRQALKASGHVREEKCYRDGITLVLYSTTAAGAHDH